MNAPLASKRKNLPHLRDMHNYDFAHWVLNVPDDWYPRVHLKLDGFVGRFGRDWDGEFFFQTARSDILRDPSSIIMYALDRGYVGEDLVRANDMAAMFTLIRDSKMFASVMRGEVVTGEFFFKDMATYDEEYDTLQFVTIPYAAEFFTTPLTIFIHTVTDFQGAEITPRIVSDDQIQVYSSRLLLQESINMRRFKKYIELIPYDQLMSLRSLKHKDRELKAAVGKEIEVVKDFLGNYLLNTQSIIRPDMGETFEGLVFHINSKQFKVVTSAFSDFRSSNEYV